MEQAGNGKVIHWELLDFVKSSFAFLLACLLAWLHASFALSFACLFTCSLTLEKRRHEISSFHMFLGHGAVK